MSTHELTAENARPAPPPAALPARRIQAPATASGATPGTVAGHADPRRARLDRVGWGMADQVMSSGTNFLTGMFAARTLGPEGFGYFSLLWATYGVLLTMSRGLATDPLTVRFSDGATTGKALRDAIARSSGVAVAFGLLTGALAVGGGALIGGDLGRGFMALGVISPALLLQDAWRYAALCAGTPRRALLNDTVWGIALVPALILAIPRAGAAGFFLAWGISAAVAAGFGYVQWRIRPDVRGALGWLHEHRDLGVRYLVENTSVSGTGQIIAFGLGALVGIADVGAMRGAGQLMGPFLVLLYGGSFVVVPEATRILRASPHRFRGFCLMVGGTLFVGALALGLTLMLVPASLGRLVLGRVWDPAYPLLLPSAFGLALASLSAGAGWGLRAMGAAKRALRAQLRSSGATIALGLLGAWLAGVRGCCWGQVGAVGFGAGLMWYQFDQALKERLSTAPPAPPTAVQVPAVFRL